MKISIVMTYYKRIRELRNTLGSFRETSHKDFEVIIVDDGTWDGEHDCSDIPEEFNDLDIKLIRINPDDKWWVNPSIVFNIGFKKATGEKVIIQNAESFHNKDIISYTANNLKENQYITYGCYALNRFVTNHLIGGSKENIKKIRALGREFPDAFNWGGNGWYNHSVHRPEQLHFCAAIHKTDLEDLGGGFDERYSHGLCHDDNEWTLRIKRKGMQMDIVDDPFVFHQFHYDYSDQLDRAGEKTKLLHVDNHKLYWDVSEKESGWKVNSGDKKRESWYAREASKEHNLYNWTKVWTKEEVEDIKKHYPEFPDTGY